MTKKSPGETKTSGETTAERTPGLSRWDGLIARMAGNIAAGLVCRRLADNDPAWSLYDAESLDNLGKQAVKIAYAIIRAIEDGKQ